MSRYRFDALPGCTITVGSTVHQAGAEFELDDALAVDPRLTPLQRGSVEADEPSEPPTMPVPDPDTDEPDQTEDDGAEEPATMPTPTPDSDEPEAETDAFGRPKRTGK